MIMSYKDQTELFIWVLFIFNWATFSCGRFDPKDNYLIDCGSPTNTSIGKRTFISDIIDLKILSTSQDVVASTNISKSIISSEDVKYNSRNRVTPYIAPHEVYSTATAMNTDYGTKFNITWGFNVDKGFRYLVRFHFCDIVSKQLNTLYFSVYIDSWNVVPALDLSALSFNSLRSALYMDYVKISTTSDKLHVSIGSSTLPSVDRDAILNGLEIMKLNNSIGSLSATSSALGISPNVSNPKKKYRVLIISASIGAFILIGLALVLSLTTCKNKRSLPLFVKRGISHFRGSKNFNGKRASGSSIVDLDFGGNRIPFVAIQEATNNFEESLVIGVGGFGKVYKGFLKDGTKVAIKRKTSLSQQGLTEFETEIKMLSQFRHRHLVSMIGYCDEQSEMILVYEYVENGTLRSHLYGSGLPVLSWKQRLEICIGAARGLHYLHTGFSKAIIHRDVKTANILLDENLKAKVADFGLSKTGPDTSQADYVSTAVKGSFGYFDPEYFRKRRLTLKSDVYSFGVVLFEVLCGRAAVDSSLPTEKIGLAGWAMKWQKTDKLEQIIDPSLEGSICPDSLGTFGEIAERCLAEFGVNRPSMGEVLQNLECVFEFYMGLQNQTQTLEHSC